MPRNLGPAMHKAKPIPAKRSMKIRLLRKPWRDKLRTGAKHHLDNRK